ncbi:arginine--tRNA ligase [uncultured Imperialibacter sp.]|uniref:arginine--tRNA ligase n=1 Tax=uncultured Imperialibacter sp. TaxID=1672639 RepID=UPI0030D96D34|tara:strand:- start:119998 stop:121785 length:1788 start_codon:yes stop_codon:yes gene_type:complete
MNLEEQLKEGISKAFKEVFNHDLPTTEVAFQPTRKEFEGSHTFVTFPYLKVTGKNPEETGKLLGDFLVAHVGVVSAYNVVKGFLNITMSDTLWGKTLSEVYANPSFGITPHHGGKVMVEFSSPNTNKPLHLGHLRNNFLGDSTSRILHAHGYEVFKVNLVNDRGIHICKSMLAYSKWGNGETPESAGLKGDHLIGKYYVIFDKEYKKEIETLKAQGIEEEAAKKKAPLILEAQTVLKKWEENDPETVSLWKLMNGWVYEGFDATYKAMGVSFDKMYQESNTYLLGKDIVDEGLAKGVFYKKVDGSVWADLTEEGLDHKLVLRSDGTSVYMTQDLGTADMKYADYPFNKSIYVVGNEQDYHFKVLFNILKRLGRNYADGLYHLSYGMVDLPSGKMKSREGTVVDADELIQEMLDTAEKHTTELGKIEGFTDAEAKELYNTLALGALKYYLLKVDPKKRMLFNPQESVEFHGHTGPFVQYTHARITAILRKAEQLSIELKGFDPSALELETLEAEVIRVIADFPDKVKVAAEELNPAVVANYVFELAKEYNRFYTEHSIFNEDNQDKVKLRVMLSLVVARTIKTGMGLLGIDVPDRM